jgi:DNA-binding MarR family transcriptional regulator
MEKMRSSEDFPENQIKILKLLFEKEHLQGDLKDKLSMTGSNLYYHLGKLEEDHLVIKKTIQQIGNAKINKISINPTARQIVRKILGYKLENFTLITGYGVLGKGYKLPDNSYKVLKELNYPINRILCFTSPDALEKRKENIKEDFINSMIKNKIYNYEEYRYMDSKFYKEIEEIINKEMKNSDIIIDLTPLSKLFSFKLLKIANRFKLPCFYLGMDKDQNYKLLNLKNMKLYGDIQEVN